MLIIKLHTIGATYHGDNHGINMIHEVNHGTKNEDKNEKCRQVNQPSLIAALSAAATQPTDSAKSN